LLLEDLNYFFLICVVEDGVQLGPLGTAAPNRPIVPFTGDYDEGEMSGMMIGKGNRSTRRKPAAVPLCPPQIPHAAWTRTRAASLGSQRLTAWATEWPFRRFNSECTREESNQFSVPTLQMRRRTVRIVRNTAPNVAKLEVVKSCLECILFFIFSHLSTLGSGQMNFLVMKKINWKVPMTLRLCNPVSTGIVIVSQQFPPSSCTYTILHLLHNMCC
jgi:hypothetical protein